MKKILNKKFYKTQRGKSPWKSKFYKKIRTKMNKSFDKILY